MTEYMVLIVGDAVEIRRTVSPEDRAASTRGEAS